jgi:CBS domain-containing protein
MNDLAHIDIEKLSNSGDLAGLAPEVLRDVVQRSELLSLRAGEAVYRAGEPYRNALYVVSEGAVELQRPDGETLRQASGTILGLSNYLDGEPYTSTAVALTDSAVLVLPSKTLQELEKRHPTLFNTLNHVIAERIRVRSMATQAIGGALARPVRSAMKAPLSTCPPDIPLRQAFALMQERRIGSLGVLTQEQQLLGLLTCSGVSEALALNRASPDDSVIEAACQTPHTIAPDAPLWQAEENLHRYGVKYLVVMANGSAVGVISQSDILRSLISAQPNVIERAMEADSLEALQRLFSTIFQVARAARETNRLASRAVRAVSEVHLALQRRCVELTLVEMKSKGLGSAPRPYALLIMGSGGRREMLLDPDQDNGIILADQPGPPSAQERDWFTEFSQRLNTNLDTIGYVLCPGNIMARNPMFHKTLSQWKRQISHMASHPNQKAARWSNVVFDFDTLYGDESLTHALRAHVIRELQQRHVLLEFMVEDDAEGRPPLGFFNRLITAQDGDRKGKIDIKRNGLRIVCDGTRIYALSAGIASCNTSERLQALVRQGILSAELVESTNAAYEELLDLLLAHQIGQQESGQKLDKLIVPDDLSSRTRDMLRVAMRAVKRFQDQLQGQFGRSAF